MHQFVKDHYDSIWGYGIETDDMVARYWKQISDDIGRDEVMIVINRQRLQTNFLA